MRNIFVLAVTFACFLLIRNTNAQHTGALSADWNEAVLRIAEEEDGFLTLKGLRTVTMMHIAMHDALNSIQQVYAPYLYHNPSPHADISSAVTQAAFVVAVDQYPDQRAYLEQLRDRSMPAENESVRRGIALGEEAARSILEQRQGDGWDTEAAYTWHPMGPGVYAEFNEHSGTPEGFIFGAGWGAAMPFGMVAHDQFTSPPPPDINSEDYTAAFNEVKEVGRFQSTQRTIDQTHFALWWKDFAENSHNRLARELVRMKKLNVHAATRLLALLNMSVFDAYVSSFYNKFLYNHWRPYTAIRWAENDGNQDTKPELNWTNTHQHTYAFPSYPSAHGTACAAAMVVMADTFGKESSFTMTTEHVDIGGPFSGKMLMKPAVRSFESFSEAAMECAMSRVYLGIHFRYDSEEGNNLGRKVGEQVIGNAMKRVD